MTATYVRRNRIAAMTEKIEADEPRAVKNMTTPEKIRWAADIGADMEMGYYITLHGDQWPARPFVMREIMKKMGYSEKVDHLANTVSWNSNPTWWPGMDVMRRMVTLTCLLREAQRAQANDPDSVVNAAFAAAMEEVLRRLFTDPKGVPNRELFDFTTKLARLRKDARKDDEDDGPQRLSISDKINETIRALPAEEQSKARAALTMTLEKINREVSA